MTRMFASGAASATDFAKSRTIDALVLNKSICLSIYFHSSSRIVCTVTGHAGLSRHASRDEDDRCSSEGMLQPITARFVPDNGASRIDVTDIRSDT